MELNKDYQSLSDRHAPKSSVVKHSILAFIGGGIICTLGEALAMLYSHLGMKEEDAYLSVTLSFIFIAALLTAFGIFDKISNRIFAGTLVPVTGFSNAVTSCAIDARSEGYVSGVGSKIFTVSGPVILFAAISGTLYGFIYFLVSLFI